MAIQKPGLGPKPTPTTTNPVSVADTFTDTDATSMLTVRINEALHRRFKAAVATQGRTMRDVVEQLLNTWTTTNSG